MDEATVEEIKRHFGIVAEDLRSDIRAVAEGQDLLREQFDGLHREFGGLQERFDGLHGEVGGLRGEVNGLRGEVGGLRGEVNGLRGEVGGLRGEVNGLRGEVGGLRGEVNGLRGDFEAFRQQTAAEFQEIKSMIRLSYAEIDRRFQVLEADVSALRQRVERIEARG